MSPMSFSAGLAGRAAAAVPLLVLRSISSPGVVASMLLCWPGAFLLMLRWLMGVARLSSTIFSATASRSCASCRCCARPRAAGLDAGTRGGVLSCCGRCCRRLGRSPLPPAPLAPALRPARRLAAAALSAAAASWAAPIVVEASPASSSSSSVVSNSALPVAAAGSIAA